MVRHCVSENLGSGKSNSPFKWFLRDLSAVHVTAVNASERQPVRTGYRVPLCNIAIILLCIYPNRNIINTRGRIRFSIARSSSRKLCQLFIICLRHSHHNIILSLPRRFVLFRPSELSTYCNTSVMFWILCSNTPHVMYFVILYYFILVHAQIYTYNVWFYIFWALRLFSVVGASLRYAREKQL